MGETLVFVGYDLPTQIQLQQKIAVNKSFKNIIQSSMTSALMAWF